MLSYLAANPVGNPIVWDYLRAEWTGKTYTYILYNAVEQKMFSLYPVKKVTSHSYTSATIDVTGPGQKCFKVVILFCLFSKWRNYSFMHNLYLSLVQV